MATHDNTLDSVFQFDPLDSQTADVPSNQDLLLGSDSKGKGVSRDPANTNQHGIMPSTSCESHSGSTLTTLSSEQWSLMTGSDPNQSRSPHRTSVPIPCSNASQSDAPAQEKGKQQELSTLPVLDFHSTRLVLSSFDEHVSTSPGASTAGPSSYGSSSFSISPPGSLSTGEPTSYAEHPSHVALHRPRSLSNISVRSTRSIAARSLTNIKSKFNHSQNKFSKALVGKLGPLRREVLSAPSSPLACSETANSFLAFEEGTFSPPSHSRVHNRSQSYPTAGPTPREEVFCTLDLDDALFYPGIPNKSLFNELLPRELQLRILESVIQLHEEEYVCDMASDKWSANKASSSKNRWVGRDRGLREIIKFSRVCLYWQDLVFDGQLWSTVALQSFPNLSPTLVDRIFLGASTFVQRLNLAGNHSLAWQSFMSITDQLSLRSSLPHTQLVEVNFQGCTGLTTRVLHYLLIRSPSLQVLCLKGQSAVTNATCDIIACSAFEIRELDLSRCHNMDARGLRALAETILSRSDCLHLTKLRISGLKDVDDITMASLGKAAPFLEVLDISCCDTLHNTAVEAFVSLPDAFTAKALGFEFITLTAREAGRDQEDGRKYYRRVTKLRHLVLSSCTLLTDVACSNLSHSVPHLEMLELAGIGDHLEEEGLIHLLETAPLIRRLDLEDCSAITDRVLSTLTPASSSFTRTPSSETGSNLEELAVSYATELSDIAFLALLRGCSKLKVLEADNTRIGSAAVKEFVKLSRSRGIQDARIVATDCRGVGETVVKEMSPTTRPRLGWRGYAARRLKYLDSRDEGSAMDLKIGQDECDPKKVVLKSFHSWQTVDAVQHARDKRRKASRRGANRSNGSDLDESDLGGSGLGRWWTPGGRAQIAGRAALRGQEMNGDGCIVM